jgi:methylmalonyl-CoA/ethylmalonyl-CoA epimerase
MSNVTELRVALTVTDFAKAVAVCRDTLGLEHFEDWSSDEGKVILLGAGRATLEILDENQTALLDQIEAGRRVAGTVRPAVEVADSR